MKTLREIVREEVLREAEDTAWVDRERLVKAIKSSLSALYVIETSPSRSRQTSPATIRELKKNLSAALKLSEQF